MNPKPKTYLENIRLLRKQRNLTSEDMCERLCISQSAYSRMETGQTIMSIERLHAIAEVLGVRYHDLIDGNCSGLMDGYTGPIQPTSRTSTATWQVCPLCHGTAVRVSSSSTPTCEVCRGHRIISMLTGAPPRSADPITETKP